MEGVVREPGYADIFGAAHGMGTLDRGKEVVPEFGEEWHAGQHLWIGVERRARGSHAALRCPMCLFMLGGQELEHLGGYFGMPAVPADAEARAAAHSCRFMASRNRTDHDVALQQRLCLQLLPVWGPAAQEGSVACKHVVERVRLDEAENLRRADGSDP